MSQLALPTPQFPCDCYSPVVRRERFTHVRGNSITKWSDVPLKSKESIKEVYSFDGPSIGEGAEGIVIAGKQKETNVPIAAKLVSCNHDITSFALLESKLLAKTDHAAVPLVIDLFRDEDFVYIIQEYVVGISLFDLLLEGPFAEDECQLIIYELLDLLDYLHQKGIVHGDIKLDNILYNRETKKMYLIDFGSAKMLDNPLECITGGSAGYMAPEIFLENLTTTKSDIWSVGVLLYTMMSGKPPFFSDKDFWEDEDLLSSAPFWVFNNYDSENLREEIVAGNPDLTDFSPALANLISKLLEVDHRNRITADEALHAPWFPQTKFCCRVLRSP